MENKKITIKEAYEMFNSNNAKGFSFYLIDEEDENNCGKIYSIDKYTNFGAINRLYLINKENIKKILETFVEKLEDENLVKEYDINIDIDTLNEVIDEIKNIELDNIDYNKVYNLISKIDEQISYEIVNDVLDNKSKVIEEDLRKNESSFDCLFEYNYIKKLIEKEKNGEVLVIADDDYLTRISEFDEIDENIVYRILYYKDNFNFKLFCEENCDSYKILVQTKEEIS